MKKKEKTSRRHFLKKCRDNRLMMKKKSVIFLMVVFLLASMSGCWDSKELNQIAFVLAMSLDKDEQTGRIQTTIQVIRPSAINRQQGGSRESPYEVISSTGKTIFDAVRNANKQMDRRFRFVHLKIIVIGEKMARSGLSPLIDFVSRAQGIRQTTWIVVTRDNAGKAMEVKHGIEGVQASYMEGIIETQEMNMNVTMADMIGFTNKMAEDGISPVAGVFSVQDGGSVSAQNNHPESKQGLMLSGTAVFKKDRLTGYLDSKETRGLNYLISEKKGSTVLVPDPTEKDQLITIEISKIDSKIKPVRSKGKVTFDLRIEVDGNITEVDHDVNVSEQKNLEAISGSFAGSVREDVRAAVIKLQNELKTDAAGFGRAYERKYPSEWEKIKDSWETEFPNADFHIDVKTKIENTGLQLEPMGGVQ